MYIACVILYCVTDMNTLTMSLYNRCLVTIIKNDVEVDFLPKPLLEDIKLLHSLHQKWTNKWKCYDRYCITEDELNEITYDTRRCADCYYTCGSRKIYCDFHHLVRDYLSDKIMEFWCYWETNN